MMFAGLGHVVLLSVLVHLAASLPVWARTEDDVQQIFDTQSVFGRRHSDARVDAQLSRIAGPERRQLGDIEFSNRYAEYLRSRAKHSSICAFLRRMQSVRKSGVGGDTEKVNVLLKQYMCPAVYSWTSDL